MMETKIQEKLKSGLEVDDFQKDGDIYLALNPDYISGDNAKYMTMYNRFARWYDLSEKWLGGLLYGKYVCGCDVLRVEKGFARFPSCVNMAYRYRCNHFGLVDIGGQCLDAISCGLRVQSRYHA